MEEFNEMFPDLSGYSLSELITFPLYTHQVRQYNLEMRIGEDVLAGKPVNGELWGELVEATTQMLHVQKEITKRVMALVIGRK
jgi:hypothetical protein